MKNLKTTLTAAAVVLILPAISFAGGKSIYGADDRVDYFAASSDMQALSDSVVSLWKSASVETLNPGGVRLKTMNFGDRLNLCPGEKFREQPIGAFCSGSLVGPDLVMTAGHCIKTDAQCKDTKFVFGYKVARAGGEAVTTMVAGEVYGCGKIVKRFLGGEPGSTNPAGQSLGPDFALVQLDRRVTGHTPLPINRSDNLRKGDGIFVIGHPVGLPLKVAGGATVRDYSKVGYFVADLDTFGGNSGSPVFNARTKKIEGILVRGDTDFVDGLGGTCTTMATYEQTGGRGEDVTKVSALSSSIPRLAGKKAVEPQETMSAAAPDVSEPSDISSKVISFE
ncbi:MAG: serine protease [Elusimicrobia bacterium]|nr:serine protease [Elusimicrobiota bacterium]